MADLAYKKTWLIWLKDFIYSIYTVLLATMTSGRTGRPRLQFVSCAILHIHTGPTLPGGTVREQPQATADHCCRGVVYLPPLTTVEARNTTRNLIHTDQWRYPTLVRSTFETLR